MFPVFIVLAIAGGQVATPDYRRMISQASHLYTTEARVTQDNSHPGEAWVTIEGKTLTGEKRHTLYVLSDTGVFRLRFNFIGDSFADADVYTSAWKRILQTDWRGIIHIHPIREVVQHPLIETVLGLGPTVKDTHEYP